VAFIARGVLEEAINVVEAAVFDGDVRNRRADVEGAVADVAEVEVGEAQMAGAAQEAERVGAFLFARAGAADDRRHRRVVVAVGAAHENLVTFDAAMAEFDRVFETILAAISRDQNFTTARHARQEIRQIIDTGRVRPRRAVACAIRRNIGAVQLRLRVIGAAHQRNGGEDGSARDVHDAPSCLLPGRGV
jgi:hypothetical protein